MYSLYRTINSLDIRLRILKEHQDTQQSQEDKLEEFSKYLTDEIETSLSKREEAENKFKYEKKKCEELVSGDKVMENLFEMVNRDIFTKQRASSPS